MLSPGYISSAIALDRGLGNSPCPWSIRVHPHQRINITLLDFAPSAVSERNNFPGSRVGSTITCRQPYARIIDRDANRNFTICSGHAQESSVYVSYGNKVDIYLTLPHNQEKLPGHFIIKYEGKVCC